MKKLRDYLEETDPKHSDAVDVLAYLIASHEAKMRDEYVLLHIKAKPRFLPEFVYKWLLKKLVVLSMFKR